MELVARNGRETLNKVLNAASRQLLICSPFIKSVEMARLIETLHTKTNFDRLSVHLITDIRPDSILDGALDIQALLDLFDSGCNVAITALARVHAKVYLADTSTVWVTSANLTTSALDYNYEYGVLIEDPPIASQIRDDMSSYAKIGSVATRLQVQTYAQTVEALRGEYDTYRRAVEPRFRQRFRERLDQVTIDALRLQVGTRSAHAVFADAITYLLRTGPMTTKALQPQIQALLPDLCDDQQDRIIDGKHFGKLWKHHVRTAQQHLKRNGLITYKDGLWMRANNM